ncbi:MAG: hypothetical protein E7336_07715 [Clostridiales bacterium]|nr:hypothetical protein [Clostridiales bacterium]
MPGAGARVDDMNQIKSWLQKMKNNRKLRCGGFSVALTAAVVLLVMLIGVLADGLEKRFALQIDCSFNAATTQSETTNRILSALDKDVHIYAIIPEEGGNATLLSLLERYAAASSHLSWSRESIMQNPVLLNQFSDAIGENEVSLDCLIISCPETGRARVIDEDDYYVYSYNPETGYFDEAGFTYEESLTEAIVYVTQDELPAIQMLTGHGELNETDTENLENTLISANYLVERINLQSGGKLDPDSLLMILAPQYDLTDLELEKIMDFSRNGGNFFIISQYSDPTNLENYHAFLRSFGIECYPGLVIAKESAIGSYYADSPVYLMPYMQETDVTYNLVASGQDILLLGGARAFYQPDDMGQGVQVTPVLLTGEAYIRNYLDGVSLSDQQEGDEEGVFALSLWSEKMHEDGTLSRLFILGNATVFTDYWVQNNTDSNAFLLQMVRSLQGADPVELDIIPKNALRENLTLGNITPAVVVTIMIPLLVLLGAAVVLLPRKNL